MNITITKNINIGGVNFTENKQVTFDVGLGLPVNPTVAQPGVLTVRGSVSAGTVTMGSGGHTIVTGQRADLYWAGGRRRGVVIGTVAGTAVPFTGGTGTDLPVTTTPIGVATPIKRAIGFAGNDLAILVGSAPAGVDGQIVLADAALAELYYMHVSNGVVLEAYYSDFADVNPLAGDAVAFAYFSHNDQAIAQPINLGIGHS